MKGLIFIKNIRLKIENYFKYLISYKKENIILFCIVNTILFLSAYRFKSILQGFVICFLLSPIFFVHLISEKNKNNIILADIENNSIAKKENKINSIKYYLFNYLKFYLIFLMIFMMLYFCSFLSSLMSLFILFNTSSKSLGLLLICMLSIYLIIEGLYTLLSSFSILIHAERNEFNPFKSIYAGRKEMKKELFSHLLSVAFFSIIIIPLILLSDIFIDYIYVYSILLSSYIILVLNFSIFDLKNRLKNKEEMKSK